MKKITNLLNKNFLGKVLFGISIVLLFVVNSLHEKYPDEFDNILGGWYILHGHLPYTGFFTHHGPIPYFIAAFVEVFSGRSFVHFRIVYAIFLAFWVLTTYYLFKKLLGIKLVSFYTFFIVFLGFMATYYWSHMLLADNISAFVLVFVYGLVFLKMFYQKSVDLKDLIYISVLSAVGIYSSLTYIYLYIIIVIFSLYLFYKNNFVSFKSLFSKRLIAPILIFLAPHIVFLVYLLISASLNDYIYQNFTFNAKYYIYNYPRPFGSGHINPIRFAIIIANDFFNNFHALVVGFKDFNFGNPMNVTMAVGNLGIILFFVLSRKIRLAVFVVLLLIFSNARSSPLRSGETDYQSAVYIFISFFNIFFLIPKLSQDINENKDFARKIIFSAVLLIVGSYSIFSFLYVVRKFDDKFFPKYMGQAPLIYDSPRFATIVNFVSSKDDYVWIGPFDFEDLFYTNGELPSKYHILIRGVGVSEKTKNEMVEDFTKNKPKIIVFDKNFSYISNKAYTYSGFFLDFLSKYYVSLSDYRDDESKYYLPDSIYPKDSISRIYIKKENLKEVVEQLSKNGYINKN